MLPAHNVEQLTFKMILRFRESVPLGSRPPHIQSWKDKDAHYGSATNPPTMTIAKGRCESEPIACDVAAGSRPRVATNIVIMIGRRRRTAPSTAASMIE